MQQAASGAEAQEQYWRQPFTSGVLGSVKIIVQGAMALISKPSEARRSNFTTMASFYMVLRINFNLELLRISKDVKDLLTQVNS
ncbi:Hypothetical protein NTJ_14115 [Nesidiocoris tenuis]|uniref:Uncharacterized protein n=1 Tax=Nesidiocoris tenuis TaxID=355587 RepID=A0ABN7BAG5_9HEMI|nr:Hypothetical protein NTJ_14115 [Nesidiocoris tenuis]